MRILENINLAKTLLKKKGLDTTNADYQAILKIAAKKLGWVGLLTKLRFEYDVDIDELEHIYDTLIKNNVDLGKVVKMSYDELSDFLYELTEKNTEDKGYKLVFNDGTYNYYLVTSYKGICKTASPAWCLKTNDRWKQYVGDYPTSRHQYVLYKKGYTPKNLMVPDPDRFYIDNYHNNSKPDIRIGITFDYKSGDVPNAHNDNNNDVKSQIEDSVL